MKPIYFLSTILLASGLLLTACDKQSGKPATSKKGVAVTVTASTDAQPRIAYVEIDSLMTQYRFCTEHKAILEAKSKQFESQLAAKQSQFQKAMLDFQQKMQKGSFTSQDQAQTAQQHLQKLQQEGAQLEQQLTKRMAAEQEKFNNTLRDSLQAFLKDYNKAAGYQLILSKQGDNVLYADQHLDITKEVIDGLNKRYKKK